MKKALIIIGMYLMVGAMDAQAGCAGSPTYAGCSGNQMRQIAAQQFAYRHSGKTSMTESYNQRQTAYNQRQAQRDIISAEKRRIAADRRAQRKFDREYKRADVQSGRMIQLGDGTWVQSRSFIERRN